MQGPHHGTPANHGNNPLYHQGGSHHQFPSQTSSSSHHQQNYKGPGGSSSSSGKGKDNFGQGKDNFAHQGKDNFGQTKDNFGHQGRDVFSGKDHSYHYKDGGTTMGKNGGYKDGQSHGGKGGNPNNSGGSQGHKGTSNNGGKDHHKGMNHPQHPQHQTLGVYSAWTAAPHPQFFGQTATSSTSTSVRWKDQGFELSDFLGQGAMGTVFKCMKPNPHTGAQETFAVKRIDLAKLRLRNNEQRLRQRLIREISILQNLGQHDNIVGYIGCFDEKETQLLFIVQEYVAGGELLAQIIDRTFYDPEASYVLRGLVRGLQFLHDAHIAHRDLKPENVLIAKSESVLGGRMKMHDVKIADFGLSKEIATDSNPVLNSKNKQQLMFEQTHQSCVGTPMYVAPEVFDKKLEASFGVDIWACGGKFPFNETLNTSERDFDTAFNLFKKKQSTPAQNALFGMLKQNPNDRWTTQQILDCGFCKIADRFLEELKTKQGSTAASTIYPVIPSPGGDSGTDVGEDGGDGSFDFGKKKEIFDFGAAAAGVCPPAASGQTPGGPTNNNSQQGGSSSSKGGPEVNAADGGPSAAVGERRTPKEVRALFETVSVEKSDGQRSGSNHSNGPFANSDGSIPPFHIPGPVTGDARHQAGTRPPPQTGKNNRSMKPPAFPPGGAGSSNKRQRFGSRGPAEVGASGEPLQQENPNANQGEQVVDHSQMNVNPNPNANDNDGLPKSSPVNRPYCHEAPMLIRENQTFKRQFWGCHRYPNCTNTENYPVFCMFCGSECYSSKKCIVRRVL
eukprot:g13519.t1